MPSRRPSAAAATIPAGSISVTSSTTTRVHRSQESNYQFAQSHHSLGNTTAQQQKIVQVLVNRLKNKLPCHSGTTLDRVESDKATQQAVDALVKLSHDSLDTIALALGDLVERLGKPEEGELTIELLQSQLFVLKVLATAMSSRWQHLPRSGSQASSRNPGSAPDSPIPPSSSKFSRGSSFDHTTLHPEPTPMEDNVARYLLSVMALFLRQSAHTEGPLLMQSLESSDVEFRDYETLTSLSISDLLESQDPPQHHPGLPRDLRSHHSSTSVKSSKQSVTSLSSMMNNTSYERTPMSLINSQRSLNALIEKFTGRIIFHISASNWTVVFARVRAKIRALAAQNDGDLDSVDLQLLSHSALDKYRLVQVLSELSSLLVNMPGEIHVAFATPLRLAIWNWISHFPEEYNDVVRGRSKLDGAPERVFDHLFARIKPGTDRQMYPALAALLCITPDRISPDLYSSQRSKSDRFMEEVQKQINASFSPKETDPTKNGDVGLVCALDLCRAAMYITPGPHDDSPLRSLASDLVHEMKSNLFYASSTKPFWDASHEHLDLSLYAEVLVALYRFLPAEESLQVYTMAMEPERSDAAKICVVRACKTLSVEAPLFPAQAAPKILAPAISRRILEISKTLCIRRAEVDQLGNMKRSAGRPKVKTTSDHGLTDRELLTLSVLALSRSAPQFAGFHVLDDTGLKQWLSSVVRLWDAPYDNSIKVSLAVNSRLLIEAAFPSNQPFEPSELKTVQFVVDNLPITTMCIATNLLTCRNDIDTQRLWLQMNVEHLALSMMRVENEATRLLLLSQKRTPAFLLSEIALLVSVTSADNDISQMAAQGLRLISFAERQVDAPENPLMSSEEQSKRIPVYEQLGDPKIMVHGRVLHQKRIRKLLRLKPFPLSIAIAAWEECYWRWRGLTEQIAAAISSDDVTARTSDSSIVSQTARNQWQNLTLFLAALGGVCVHDPRSIEPLSKVIPSQYLPDQIRVRQNHAHMVQVFVKDLTRHLFHDDIQIRDAARDALGSELDSKLYGRLIKHLEEAIDTTNDNIPADQARLIGEQSIAVLKLMVDNHQERMEEMLSLDITTAVQALATFLHRAEGGPELTRLKIKFCTLCDTTADRPDTLTLRKDSNARRIILNIVSAWLKPPDDDYIPQAELNMACLRTTVKLLDRVDLKEQESTNVADDGSHYVTREFSKYFKILQLGLAVACPPDIASSDSVSDMGSIQKRMRASFKEAEVRELVITGLSHLVSSDPEVGLKQCLDLAYGDDSRSRAIFAHVFARVIGQGAKFEALDQVETQDRYKRLAELVKEPNLVLAQAICDTCPTNEIDSMVSVLLNIFNTRQSLMSLLKFMITREVTHTENESSLFRSNSIYNRFLSAFAKIQGYNYLRQLIEPIVLAMAELPVDEGYELDPARAEGQDLDKNQRTVEFLTTNFLKLIFSSRAGLPPMFREVCNHIHDTVSRRWPAQKTLRLTAVGGFLFLRFISPAVVAPETVDINLPNESLRRGLMIIAKIIQNLANNVQFGKEPHMMRLNDYLATNMQTVTGFFSMILKEHFEDDDRDEWLGSTGSDDTDGIVLHRFFDKHADKIGKELLSISKPSVDGETNGVAGKRTWDNLCTLLVDLGAPLEIPRASSLDSRHHKDYMDLMARYENRSRASVEHIFVPVRRLEFTDTALLSYKAYEIDVETVDLELILSHLFKTLEDTPSNFDIVLDCTGFSTKNILPLRWLKYCLEIIPVDIRARFRNAYILNNNMEGQKYMKRVFNFSGGMLLASNLFHVSSVDALKEHIPDMHLRDLGYAALLEEENTDDVMTATIKVSPLNPNQNAVVQIAHSHVRITCLSATGAVEIIPMADISDAYVTGLREKHEFIIRRNRQGTTLYLSSPANDHIVKTIRAAKGRIAENHTSLGDRFSRYSNIPATLLHVGMLNVDMNDEEVRTAAYDLLGAVCTYLGYEKNFIVAPKAGFIPGDPSLFVVQLSERIAEFAPQLTLDFISEVTAAMKMDKRGHIGQYMGCLYYLSPWIKNLAHFANPTHPLFDRSASRLRDTIRGLSDLSMSYPELRSAIQKHVWSQVGLLESQIADIVLDELIRGAIDSGAGTSRCEAHAHIIASFTSIGVRGRLFSKLRKAIIKASPRQMRSLVDSANWNEVSTLSRICLIAGYQTKQPVHNQLYIPEVVHSVMMIAGMGATIVRKSVYGIAMNLLQSLCMARAEESIPNPDLVSIMTEVGEDSTLELFGLRRVTSTSEYTSYDPPYESMLIEHYERLAQLLLRILDAASGTKGLLNVWRARWMSLVTSSAFQYSAMIQMRSCIVLGVLATSSLEDDFIYQALVAFSSSLAMMEPQDTLAAVGILRAISKLLPGLPEDTRFLPPLFWMGVAFLQSGYIAFYTEAAHLIQTTLEIMDQRNMFKSTPVATFLLNARTHLEEDACELDQNLCLSFDSSFSFALAAIIFKGLRRPGEMKDAAESLLRTLIRVTVRREVDPVANHVSDSLHPDVLGYFIALIPLSTTSAEYSQLLKECHADDMWLPEAGAASFDDDTNVPAPSALFLGLHGDQTLALFTVSFISAILMSAQGDDTETQILYSILSDIATVFPDVVSMAYESLQERIKDTFANSSNASVIRYVSDIIRVALQDSTRWTVRGSASTLHTADDNYPRLGPAHAAALEEYAMAGLGEQFKFLPTTEGFHVIVPLLVRIIDAIVQPVVE